ncbi:hypothetical protein H206_02296 [Candidatus Electrothrix aarhusensis]|jgi:hypothetical protein|uniref:Uncharacterized protein n=1 Tax=Candidatus Electrothrix aarhusensis TaxID=1859131 RepID=A0A3S3RSY6_9BACT|nr:hypothetical protein H206_02296 [Candidatus Electrothrix aarhusensis]
MKSPNLNGILHLKVNEVLSSRDAMLKFINWLTQYIKELEDEIQIE